MSQSIGKNVLANFVGQVWMGVVGVAFIPLYVGHIGIESFGIIGFFAMLMAFYSILDMGLSATLSREMSIGSVSENPHALGVLLRTIECIYLPFGVLIAAVTWTLSAWISSNWLQLSSLRPSDAGAAIALLGISAALQWPSSLYAAGLNGLQRQVLLNTLRVVLSTISAFGCLFVLHLSPTLSTYIQWQILSSAMQSAVFAVSLYAVLPRGSVLSRFSGAEFRRIRGFAGGVMLTTIVSLALTQADKLILSRILSLEQFAFYALASALAATVYRIMQPLYLAYAPRFAQLTKSSDTQELSRQYHLANRLMATLLAPVMAVAVFFGNDIILLWSRDAGLTAQVAPIFSLLTVAFCLHALVSLPYALQLAFGWTQLSFWINLTAFVLVVPVFWFLGAQFGGIGASWGWVILASLYFIIGPLLMHQRLLRGEAIRWYLGDVALVLFTSFAAAGGMHIVFSPLAQGVLGWGQLSLISALVFLAAGLCLTKHSPVSRWVSAICCSKKIGWF